MTKQHGRVTGFSGNEIFCLEKMNCTPGQLCLGNAVVALGIKKGFGAALSTLGGGEITEITDLVHSSRKKAFERLEEEAKQYGGVGIAGTSFDLINRVGNLEFVATASTIHSKNSPSDSIKFSTSASAQELYCQIDSGFKPHKFVFGNVAYSIGVGGGIKGALRGLKRGEVDEYTKIFEQTRYLALSRIKEEAKKAGANSVIGIETSITPLLGAQEMMMVGTASSHPALDDFADDPVTSDMTNEELWNMVNIGYLPVELVMGVSVYSLGFGSGIKAALKGLTNGEVGTLTELLYEARGKALAKVEAAAEECGADKVVGVKTKIYDLGGGLVEFVAIGTAVKKVDGITTKNSHIIPQAIIQDKETFVEEDMGDLLSDARQIDSAPKTQSGPLTIIVSIIFVVIVVILKVLGQ